MSFTALLHPGAGQRQGVVDTPFLFHYFGADYKNRLTLDPELKCHLPGVPRATYLPYPFQIFSSVSRGKERMAIVYQYSYARPNGKLMETILAGFAQFDNDIRSLRSVQGMQQRIREGLWPWKPPLGYLPPKLAKKRSPINRDPRCFKPSKMPGEC
jgi:hypothetical protein